MSVEDSILDEFENLSVSGSFNSSDGSFMFYEHAVPNEILDDDDSPNEAFVNPCPASNPFAEYFNRQGMTAISSNIYKKILKPGSGGDLVDLDSSSITYRYAKFLEFQENPYKSTVQYGEPGIVNFRENIEPSPAYVMCLSTMTAGEEAVFWISREVFSNFFVPGNQQNGDILFFAKITDVKPFEESENNDETVSSFNKEFKQAIKNFKIAQESYNLGDFQQAVSIFLKWIGVLENVHTANDEEESKRMQLLAKMYQNAAATYNHMKRPERACIMIQELEKLTSIKGNRKALLTKGKAKMMLNDFGRAHRCFEAVKKVAPVDKPLAEACKELEKRKLVRARYEEEMAAVKSQVLAEEKQSEEKARMEAEAKRRRDEELRTDLKKFEGELQVLIDQQKDDPIVKYLSLRRELPTREHLQVAKDFCSQHGLHLKGFQLFTNEKIIYYMTK